MDIEALLWFCIERASEAFPVGESRGLSIINIHWTVRIGNARLAKARRKATANVALVEPD